MQELLTAIYRSIPICIFDLLDNNGQYIEEKRSEYRKASQANELYCPECNGVLELCAGAKVIPYFRHKSISDCPISRELKTEAGKRKFYGRKMLLSLGKSAPFENITLKERNKELPYNPVVLEMDGKTEAFIYLDGSSRNYEELKNAWKLYKERDIKPYWFLDKKYQSNSKNLTSNEAEVAALNDDIMYYLDPKNKKVDIRKKYKTPYGEYQYYTQTVSDDELQIDETGAFDQAFLLEYERFVEKQKRKLDRVLRIKQDEGIDELYFDFSYVYMTAIEEIWILPEFQIKYDDQELNDKAIRQREAYLEYCNELLLEEGSVRRSIDAVQLENEINRKRFAYNWSA